jgi:hypothetical protein
MPLQHLRIEKNLGSCQGSGGQGRDVLDAGPAPADRENLVS